MYLALDALAQTNTLLEQQISKPDEPRVWQVCNETSYILNVAVASIYEGDDNPQMTVKGWHRLRSGKCQIMKIVKSAPRYVYARSDSIHQGGIREWKGAHEFCVGSPDITPNFNAQIQSACNLQNLTPAKFLRIIPTEERTAFIEPANFGKKSETAGLQRLLLDNNYDIKRIDGLSGRRTLNTLNTFLKDNKLKTNIALADKINALETSALEIRTQIGVRICNTSNARIWSAIAWHDEHHWESRGWWLIDPKACIRPFTNSLKDAEVYLYARLETDSPQDMVLDVKSDKANKNFCISEASFAAVAHEYCQDQGYVNARFKAIPNDQIGISVNLSNSDFSKPKLSGLR